MLACDNLHSCPNIQDCSQRGPVADAAVGIQTMCQCQDLHRVGFLHPKPRGSHPQTEEYLQSPKGTWKLPIGFHDNLLMSSKVPPLSLRHPFKYVYTSIQFKKNFWTKPQPLPKFG